MAGLLASDARIAPIPKMHPRRGLLDPPTDQDEHGTDLTQALGIASYRGNGSPSDIYNKIIIPMSYHESDRTFDPLHKQDLKARGDGLGVARGVLQFEPPRMKSALNRATAILGSSAPDWIKNARKNKNYDASTLTGEQQQALAIYDLLKLKGADMLKVTNGEQSIEDFWIKNWWKGKEEDEPERRKAFRSNMSTMQQ